MGNWFLAAGVGAVAIGALAFLRVVSNELEAIEQETDFIRKKELAKKHPVQEEVITAGRAAWTAAR
jgi:hypothetical protein